jgi:hypothetical protein
METMSRFSCERKVHEILAAYEDSGNTSMKEVLSSPTLLTGFFYEYALKDNAFDRFVGLFPDKELRTKLEISDSQIHRCLMEVPILQAVGAIAAIESVYEVAFSRVFRVMLTEIVVWHSYGSSANEHFDEVSSVIDDYLRGVRALDLDLCAKLFYERTYTTNRFMNPQNFTNLGSFTVTLMKLGSTAILQTFYSGIYNVSYDEIRASAHWNSIKPTSISLISDE